MNDLPGVEYSDNDAKIKDILSKIADSFNKTDEIEVTFKIKLNKDHDEQAAREVVNKMEYLFDHPSIESIEIIKDNVEESCIW